MLAAAAAESLRSAASSVPVWFLCATVGLGAACSRPSDRLSRRRRLPNSLPSCGSALSRAATCSGASAGNGSHPIPTARYTVIEIKRSGFSRGYTVDGSERPGVEREVSSRGPDRGRRVADRLGRRLPPAADLLPRGVDGGESHVSEPATPGPVPREEPRSARARRDGIPGRTTRTRLSARGN